MISKLFNTLNWLPSYYLRRLKHLFTYTRPDHIYFCICDHFEPYWNKVDKKTASKRIQRWLDEYPKIADRILDSNNKRMKYTFFYPEEEYQKDDLNALAELCRAGYGEVEIHLHHDNDTSENLRRTLIDYKKRLYEDHGLLSIDSLSGEIAYGFIHGNWALDNSRPDGRLCGVNNEIEILIETGCFADFTMPSAPDDTQTRKVNSIYFAQDDPNMPKSHDTGIDAKINGKHQGLLMIQGPLSPAWHNKKWGFLPRIENGGLMLEAPITPERVRCWINTHICVINSPRNVFVKLYTHGTQEKNMRMFFDEQGLLNLLDFCLLEANRIGAKAHFVSAREMTNKILSILSIRRSFISSLAN